MVRVVADQPLPLVARTGHDVEVVHVVAGGSHRGAVPAVRHEHHVTVAHLGHHVDRPAGRAVHPLEAERPGVLGCTLDPAHLEVVDLLELALAALVLLVVLVRRVRRPVAGRGEDLTGDDGVGVEHVGGAEVAHLARGVTGAAQLGDALLGRDPAERQGPVGRRVGQREPGTAGAGDRDARHPGNVGEVGRTGERVGATLEEQHLVTGVRLDPALARQRQDEPLAPAGHDQAALTRRQGQDVQSSVLPAGFPGAERHVEPVAGRRSGRAVPVAHVLPPWVLGTHRHRPACTLARSLHRGTARRPPSPADDEGARFHVEPGPFGQPCGRTLLAPARWSDLSRRRRRGSPWPGPRGAGAPAPRASPWT